jgi:hypothetical protein
MTGWQDDRKEYDRTKDRQRILDEYMIEDSCLSFFFSTFPLRTPFPFPPVINPSKSGPYTLSNPLLRVILGPLQRAGEKRVEMWGLDVSLFAGEGKVWRLVRVAPTFTRAYGVKMFLADTVTGSIPTGNLLSNKLPNHTTCTRLMRWHFAAVLSP